MERIRVGAVPVGTTGEVRDALSEGDTTPFPDAADDKMISPDVTKTAVPAGRDALRLGLRVALTKAGSVEFSDGNGTPPVDATSDSEGTLVVAFET